MQLNGCRWCHLEFILSAYAKNELKETFLHFPHNHMTAKVIEFRPFLACRNKQHHQKNNGVHYGATKGTGGAAACNRKSRT